MCKTKIILDVNSQICLKITACWFAICLSQQEVSVWLELPKMLLGQSEYTLPAMLKLLESSVFPAVPPQWAEETTTKLRNSLIVSLNILIQYLFLFLFM